MVYAIWIFKGILAWMATGADDCLSMYAIIYERIKCEQLKTIAGTIAGTCLMFVAAKLISGAAFNIVGSTQYLRLLGLVPAILGWNLLSKNLSIEQKEETHHDTHRFRSVTVLAAAVYLANSTDDLSVNSSLILQSPSLTLHLCLLAGNIIGCSLCALATIAFHRRFQSSKFQRRIGLSAGCVLILMGFSIVCGFWQK